MKNAHVVVVRSIKNVVIMPEKLHKHCFVYQRVEVDGKWIDVRDFKAKYPGVSATSGYCSQECLDKNLDTLTPKIKNAILKKNKECGCHLSKLKPC